MFKSIGMRLQLLEKGNNYMDTLINTEQNGLDDLGSSEFIYIADTHFGANPVVYSQQHAYNEYLPEIIQALKKWIIDNGNIDFILHGGDIIDELSKTNINLVKQVFLDLPVPVYLCLGNHDLTEKNSLALWLDNAGRFFKENKPCYCIEYDNYVVHVMPSQWSEIPYYWNQEQQNIDFLDEQLQDLEKNISKYSDKKIQILLTHSSVFGLPVEQTGFSEPYHDPGKKFHEIILGLAEKYSSLKVVLGAHNHMNMYLRNEYAHFVTVSSFSEVPFEFKHFKIDDNNISMSTVSLLENINFKIDYDFNKTYVQGRPCDRTFKDAL